MTMPAEGDLSPDFEALTDDGQRLRLSALRGRPVVLFFYPKDDTPACTIEASGFRDALPRLDGTDAVLLGVSPDSAKKHCRFKAKYGLPYTLIADTDHAVAERYGVWQEKTMFGVKYWGNVRTTFLIGRDGHIVRRFDNVKAKGHADEVVDAAHSLAG